MVNFRGRCPHAPRCILKWEWWGRYQYKRRTHKPKTDSTNVGLVQMSDQFKRRKKKKEFFEFLDFFSNPHYISSV